MMKIKSILSTFSLALCMLPAGAQHLVKDITPGGIGSRARAWCACDDKLFLLVQDPNLINSEFELWKTDGTESGTMRVKEINPTDGDITSWNLYDPVCLDGKLLFVADNGTHGKELWSSDGTEAGTVMVKDIFPGAESATPRSFAVANNKLFFIARDYSFNYELWVSDGTEAGTMLVKDVWPGQWGQEHINNAQYKIVSHNGAVYFTAKSSTSSSSRQLWKSDGTEAGTVMVREFTKDRPRDLTVYNGELYFAAGDVATGEELWKTDGTEAGTVLVHDIQPGTAGSYPGKLTVYNGSLYFFAATENEGWELWKTEGDASGTQLVKDIRPGASGAISSTPLPNMYGVNGVLVFPADGDGLYGNELWKTDGTEAGTTLLKTIRPDGVYSLSPGFIGHTYSNLLYFSANNGTHGEELWRTDGTEAGTYMVADMNPGGATSHYSPSSFYEYNEDLYFSATIPAYGTELWHLNSPAGTGLLEASAFSIHPNPTSGKIILENSNYQPASAFTVVNFMGQQVAAGTLAVLGKTEVDLSHLPAGVYFIQAQGANMQTYKLIKK